ncbi:MAG: insulinase family protein [Sandaracinus sp.]|nr:insulinase family protein [Sandaracinus sp.]MCB9615200.1 insulinase family protein [Sandaracinus sp.]
MKTRLVLLMLAVGCGPSLPRATGEIPPIDTDEQIEEVVVDTTTTIEREDLGVAQLVEARSDSPIVTLRVVFDAGSAEDPEGHEGLARLAARLRVEGGAGERSYAELVRALYPMAGSIDASVSREQTAFVGRVHRDHLDAFYAIFREVLTRPRYDERDFERLLARAKSALSLELRGSDDETLGKELLHAMLYEEHPYGHPELGTERGLDALTRQDVLDFAARFHCGGRAVVGVAGAYPEGFADRVMEDLAGLDSDRCVGRRVLPEPATPGVRVWIADKSDAQSVAMSLGVPLDVTRDHPDYPALTLAAAWLGQHRTFAGWLMNEMRGKRGLNYGDYAYAEHFEQEGWSRFPAPHTARRQQYFSFWIRPVPREKAHFALRFAVKAFREQTRTGMTQADLDRIRTFIEGYFALYLQTESRALGFSVDDRYYDTADPWLEGLRAAWRELTVEQVNAALRRHVDPQNLQIALVASDAASFADQLASEVASPMRHAGATVPDDVRAMDEQVASYRLGIPRERMRVIPAAELFAR